MAKRQKVKRFSVKAWDNSHYRQTDEYTRAVDVLFDRATAEISKAASRGKYDLDKPFSFEDYPSVQSVMQKVIKGLANKVTTVIESGSKKQWLFACAKNDGFIDSIMDTSKISKARLKKMQDRNLEALHDFQARKIEGMNLSQRVWKYTTQYKNQIEVALDVGLGEGRSAQQLARDVKQNLKYPDKLFRRVRDKRGNLVLSRRAAAFHPGQGVYRSSVKNAQRLTRSEINMAYRESDFLRWQQLDFVVGIEVKRSNHEPLCKCDVCKKLVGRYPKGFKFKGWHPQCMCYAVPILMDEDEFDDNELGDLKAALRGTTYKKQAAKNTVNNVPKGFQEWVDAHIDAQKNWSSTPYFIRDNFVDGNLGKGLKPLFPIRHTSKPEPKVASGINYNEKNPFIEDYVGGDMMWINQYLRGKGDFGELSEYEKKYLDGLTNVTTMEKVGERVLYRSVDASAIFGKMSDIDYENLIGHYIYGDNSKFVMSKISRFLGVEGKELIEKGFMSTTKDVDIASGWGDYTGADHPIMMKIRTNANTKGLDVERYEKIHHPDIENDEPQREVLLSRGQKYKILSVSKEKGNICVEVELLDDKVAQAKPKIAPVQLADFEAKTPKEAVDFIIQNIAESCTLEIKPSDLPLVNRILNQLDSRMKMFGIPKFTRLGKPRGREASASWDEFDNSLNLNFSQMKGKEWKKNQKWLAKGIKYTHFVDEDDVVRQNIDHELGHYLMHKFHFKKDVINAFGEAGVTRNGVNEINDILGYYASTDVEEYFAEAFSMFMSADRGKLGNVTREMLERFAEKVMRETGKNPFAESGIDIVDPKQKELDALAPQIQAVKARATEYGTQTMALDNYIAKKDIANVKRQLTSLKSSFDELDAKFLMFMNNLKMTIQDANKNNVPVDGVLSGTITKRDWYGKDVIFENALTKLKKAIEDADTTSDKPHKAVKQSYTTNEDVNDTFQAINAEFASEKWFENGDLRLMVETNPRNNGSTYMDGRIYLKPDRLEKVKSALGKIGQKKSADITFQEADAMATFWHEITHNRNKHGNTWITENQRRAMELANEFIARHSLTEFYSKLGVKVLPHPEFQTTRSSTGYNRRVCNYQHVIKVLNLDEAVVLKKVREHLFNERYDIQQKGLEDALIAGGLKKADGKKATKISTLMKMIRDDYSEETIDNWLKENGYL